MSNLSSVQLKFQEDTCQTPRRKVMGCSRTSKESMVVWVCWRQQHSIIPSGYDRRSPQLISEVNAAVKQMSCSSHYHHDLAHSFCGATLDDIHGLKFPHWRATAAPTRLVGVCYKQVFQPRTVGAGECATLAKSKAHTKSWESTVGRNLCSMLRSRGDDLDQSIVGIDDLERF